MRTNRACIVETYCIYIYIEREREIDEEKEFSTSGSAWVDVSFCRA